MKRLPPPADEDELRRRVDGLAGRTLAEISGPLNAIVPPDLSRNKGWMGQVLEAALGANAGSRPVPDFEELGIELKSIPLDTQGRVKEGTFVSTAPQDGSLARTWKDSRVCHKLSRVLWVPLVGDGPPGTRMIGASLLWSPSDAEEALLQADWSELAGLLALGEHWQVDARRGKVLQLRPKGQNRDDLTWTLDQSGEWIQTGHLGFYLRATFTKGLLARFRS